MKNKKEATEYPRCTGDGWVELARPDGRRGIWMRVTEFSVELCAGREGDDEYVSFEMGKSPTKRDITQAKDVLAAFEYAQELGGVHEEQEQEPLQRVVCVDPCRCNECTEPDAWVMYWTRLPNGHRAGSARPIEDAIDLAVLEAIRLGCEVWT